MMKRLMCVWLITVVASGVLAAEVWEYRVSSALFGTLGKVMMREERTGKQYHITAVAETRGIAATLTRHRKYRAESRGIVGTQRRHSRYYLYEVVDHKKHKRDEYRIDPKAKKVIKTSQRWKKGKPEKKEQHRLDYYTDRDLASLFYDLVTAPTAIRSGEYPAVGAEKSHGRVRIELPDARSAQKERERLQASPQSRILYILIDQKGGKQRKIIAAVTPQGRLESAYTVAVPVVGVLYMKPR